MTAHILPSHPLASSRLDRRRRKSGIPQVMRTRPLIASWSLDDEGRLTRRWRRAPRVPAVICAVDGIPNRTTPAFQPVVTHSI